MKKFNLTQKNLLNYLVLKSYTQINHESIAPLLINKTIIMGESGRISGLYIVSTIQLNQLESRIEIDFFGGGKLITSLELHEGNDFDEKYEGNLAGKVMIIKES